MAESRKPVGVNFEKILQSLQGNLYDLLCDMLSC